MFDRPIDIELAIVPGFPLGTRNTGLQQFGCLWNYKLLQVEFLLRLSTVVIVFMQTSTSISGR